MGHVALRGLQGIQFEIVFLNLLLDVRGEVAGPFGPLDGRFAIGLAVNACGILHCPVAPLTGLDDGIAPPTIVRAAILLHEDALRSHLYGLTNHDDLPPFSTRFFERVKIIELFKFMKRHKKKRATRISVTRFGKNQPRPQINLII